MTCLCQPFVGSIGMQADRIALAVKSADRRQSVSGMPDHCSSLESKAASCAIRLSFTPLGCLQAMDLTPVELSTNDVPQAGTAWLRSTADRCSHNPAINGM